MLPKNHVDAALQNFTQKIFFKTDDDDTLAGIAAGDIYGTVVQNPFEFGKQSVARMEKYLKGDKTQLDGKMFIPTQNVKKDSVADYQAYKKKILGK